MAWYKAFHGLPYDPQLAVVARRAGISRAEALALWVALLDHASQNTPRGSLSGLDPEKISVALDLDPPRVDAALAALSGKGLIDAANNIAGWAAAQTSSNDRVRACRARRGGGKRLPLDSDTPEAIAARHARLRAQETKKSGRTT